MKHPLLILWALVPLLLIAAHLRFGKAGLERDRIQSVIRASQAAAAREDWKQEADLLAEAAESLRNQFPEKALRLDLAKALAHARAGDARTSSEVFGRIFSDPTLASLPPTFHRDLHEAAGRFHYNVAWLQRIDGAPRKDWMSQSDRARRHFRLLAESRSGKAPTRFTEGQKQNLEAAVRLQRMGIDELKGLPPPGLLPGGSSSGDGPPTPNPGENTGQGSKPGQRQPGGSGDADSEEGNRGNRGKRAAPPAEGSGS